MKELIIILCVAAISLVLFDNHNKRIALEQANARLESVEVETTQRQIRELTAERDQLKQQLGRPVAAPRPPSTPAATWFQDRLKESPRLQ